MYFATHREKLKLKVMEKIQMYQTYHSTVFCFEGRGYLAFTSKNTEVEDRVRAPWQSTDKWHLE